MVREHVHTRVFPHFTGLGSVTFLAGILLMFSGIEVQGVQAANMKNPRRDFPIAMLLASAIAFLVYLMGSLAVATVLTPKEISLTAGLMEAFSLMLHKFDLDFLVPLIALLITFGKVNKAGAPVALLAFQGVIVLALSSIYFLVKNVSMAFFILTTLTASIYLAMYLLMFGAAIRLRITRPDLPRTYSVPGGIMGMFLIGGTGLLGVAFAFTAGFFPPHNLPVGNPALYVALVAGGLSIFIAIPLIIQAFKKPQWKHATHVENDSSINGNNGD